mmetsp:Transcript_27418/g.71983  ORF Transcript_27418/g.71983 Transcript_27418/m.71983 type:complete len:772 (-) Transcript_27418:76-2391(-)
MPKASGHAPPDTTTQPAPKRAKGRARKMTLDPAAGTVAAQVKFGSVLRMRKLFEAAPDEAEAGDAAPALPDARVDLDRPTSSPTPQSEHPVSSFPNFGVSLAFLRRVRDDPRLGRPVVTLPLVGPTGKLSTPPDTTPALERLDDAALRQLAADYRVFSDLDGMTEHRLLHGPRQASREELVEALCRPPHTTTQVNLCIVKPDTLAAGCSYAEMLLRTGRGPGNVGKPTVFLSHAWRYSFVATVDALIERFGDALDVRVWNDIFVENQNKATNKPQDYFFTAFREAIGTIGHTVLVLSPWHSPIPLTRAWCLWEIFSSVPADVKFEIVLSAAERERLRQAVLADASALTGAMVEVDARKAEAFVEADRERIFAAIEDMPGGSHTLNVQIKGLLRDWITQAVRDLCSTGSAGAATGPPSSSHELERALLYNHAGTTLRDAGDFKGAVEHQAKALAIRRAVLGPKHPLTAESLNDLGFAIQGTGDLDGALAHFLQCLAIREAVLPRVNADTALTLNNIANVFTAKGDLDSALATLQRSLDMRKAVLGPEHALTAQSHNNIGRAHFAKGDYSAALAAHKTSLAIKEATLEPNHPQISTSHNNIGTTLKALGDLEGAMDHYRKALAIREEHYGTEHVRTVTTRANIQSILDATGCDVEVEVVQRTLSGPRSAGFDGPSHDELGQQLQEQGDYVAALNHFRKALACAEEDCGPDHINIATCHNNIANALRARGDYTGALKHYRRCLSIREVTLGPDHPHTSACRANIATTLTAQHPP